MAFAVYYGEKDHASVQKMFVKPKIPGTTVRQVDHNMRPLPQDGAWVVASMFWMRRLLCGDIVETAPPPEPEIIHDMGVAAPAEIMSDELAVKAKDAADSELSTGEGHSV